MELNVMALVNGMIGTTLLVVIAYVLGFIWNKLQGEEYDDYFSMGVVILLILGVILFVLYNVGGLMESLKIALF